MKDKIEIFEKYDSKGFLIERYYFVGDKRVDLNIPEYFKENPAVSYCTHPSADEKFKENKIEWARTSKFLTKEEFKLLETSNNKD